VKPLPVAIAIVVAILTAILLPWWNGANTWIAWGVGIVTWVIASAATS
jgi:hypothetical protein